MNIKIEASYYIFKFNVQEWQLWLRINEKSIANKDVAKKGARTFMKADWISTNRKIASGATLLWSVCTNVSDEVRVIYTSEGWFDCCLELDDGGDT